MSFSSVPHCIRRFWYPYSAFLRHDLSFPAPAQANYITAFRSALQALQRSIPDKVLFLHCEQCVIAPHRQLGDGDGTPCLPPAWCADKGNGSAVGISGQAIQDFYPSREFVDIVRYMAACGKWFKSYVDPVSSRANCSDPDQRGALLAAWLVSVGEGHFFLCGVEGQAEPLPEFRLPLGEPLDEARPLRVGDLTGLTRTFKSGTKATWLPGANSTARGTGCVEWAGGVVSGVCPHHTEEPVPLPLSTSAEATAACTIVDISTGHTTLHQAQDKARSKKATAPCVIVNLGARTFHLTEPLVLTSDDSDIQYHGQGAEITTGIDVPPGAWTPVTENGVAAVQVNATPLVNRSQWGKFTLSKGLEDAHLSLLVKVGGVWRPMTVARWPNVPFDYSDSPPVNWTNVGWTNCPPANSSCLDFTWPADIDRPARWVNAAKEHRLFLHGFFVSLWEDSRGQIQEVDVASRRLRSTVSNPQQDGGVNNESVFYAYGMYEELDQEGEYILREDTGMLSAVMPSACIGADGSVVCPTRLLPDIEKLHFQTCTIVGHAYLTSLNCSMAGVVQVIDTANITLRGLNITGSFGTGVSIFGGSDIELSSCAINNHNTGLVVGTLANTNETSSRVSLLRSEVSYTRDAASRWTGGDRPTLTKSGFLVEGNRFENFGLYHYILSPGVVAGGVGVVVRKNEFRSALHTAILFGGAGKKPAFGLVTAWIHFCTKTDQLKTRQARDNHMKS